MANLTFFRGRTLLVTDLFAFRASTKPFPVANEAAYTNQFHPLHQRSMERYQQRLHELNLYTVVPISEIKSSCIRSRIRRRIKEATRLALAEHGYMLDGRPLNKSETGGEGEGIAADALLSTKRPKDLLGTLVYYPEFGVVSAKFATLQQNITIAIDKFIEMRDNQRADDAEYRRRAEELLKQRGPQPVRLVSPRGLSGGHGRSRRQWREKM